MQLHQTPPIAIHTVPIRSSLYCHKPLALEPCSRLKANLVANIHGIQAGVARSFSIVQVLLQKMIALLAFRCTFFGNLVRFFCAPFLSRQSTRASIRCNMPCRGLDNENPSHLTLQSPIPEWDSACPSRRACQLSKVSLARCSRGRLYSLGIES